MRLLTDSSTSQVSGGTGLQIVPFSDGGKPVPESWIIPKPPLPPQPVNGPPDFDEDPSL